MDDPIPEGFITLPEALQRIASMVLDSHLESEKTDSQDYVQAFADDYPRFYRNEADLASEEAAKQWSKRHFACNKLRFALQAGAIPTIVRDPGSGINCRLTSENWHSEPFWFEIIRGGIIRPGASGGFERHQGRTVLVEKAQFEQWLPAEVKKWFRSSPYQLCFEWLLREMRASPNEKGKDKDQWFHDAKIRYGISRRQFDVAWAAAVKETDSNWSKHGAPKKSSRKSPR